jgi:hypothetical protein
MDLRGMRLVDGLFLTLSLAIMQSYIAIRCSDDAVVCPGREGFDFFLGASIVASLFSGALSFLALDFNDVKVRLTSPLATPRLGTTSTFSPHPTPAASRRPSRTRRTSSKA